MSTREEEQHARRAFGGWKLDVIHAIATDKRLQPSDVRVGVAMMRFLASGTLSLYPSQELLTHLTSMSLNNVVSCLKRLKATGWISWERGNRQLANVYHFDADQIADQLARVKREEQERRRKRSPRKPISDPQPTVGQKANPDPQPAVGRDPQPTGTQHLNGSIPTESSEQENAA